MVNKIIGSVKLNKNKSKSINEIKRKKDKNNKYNKKINLSKEEYQWTPWPGLIDD